MFMLGSAGNSVGCTCFLFIFFIVVIVQIINAVAKSAKNSGTFNLESLSSEIQRNIAPSLMQTQQDTEFGMRRAGEPVNRPPIYWNLIRLNLTKDQIRECFDMEALSKGVKKEELYKYVYLDRLRNYFTDPQLADMIDLQFFEKSTEVDESAGENILTAAHFTPLQGMSSKTAVIPEPPRQVKAPQKEFSLIESLRKESFDETFSEANEGSEEVEEEFSSEGSLADLSRARFAVNTGQVEAKPLPTLKLQGMDLKQIVVFNEILAPPVSRRLNRSIF